VIASSHSSPLLRLLHRTLAVGAAALVLLLTVLAVSPQLHADLHAADPSHAHHHGPDHSHSHDPAPSDEGCVVTLFGAGVTAAPAPLVVLAPTVRPTLAAFAPRAEIFVSSPRYLHQPERGPPVG
jgi:hypothetical protein